MTKKSPVRKTIRNVSGQTISHVRELSWTGQHAKAIELATEALSTPKIKPAEQMNLLDLRAKSYIAQGKLDLAAKEREDDGEGRSNVKGQDLQAQALNRTRPRPNADRGFESCC